LILPNPKTYLLYPTRSSHRTALVSLLTFTLNPHPLLTLKNLSTPANPPPQSSSSRLFSQALPPLIHPNCQQIPIQYP
jgi:hypothetical protein